MVLSTVSDAGWDHSVCDGVAIGGRSIMVKHVIGMLVDTDGTEFRSFEELHGARRIRLAGATYRGYARVSFSTSVAWHSPNRQARRQPLLGESGCLTSTPSRATMQPPVSLFLSLILKQYIN
jgi:hypothetical protein